MIGAKTGIYASVGQFEAAYEAALTWAASQGITAPSEVDNVKYNTLLKKLRESATNGIASYSLIKMQVGNIAMPTIPANFGFYGINLAAAGSNQSIVHEGLVLATGSSGGVSGNGVDAYIDENWIPSTDGNVTAQDIFIAKGFVGSDAGVYLEGVTSNSTRNRIQISPYFSGSSLISLCQDDFNYFGNIATGEGRYIYAKDGVDTVGVYKDGSFLENITSGATSATLPSRSLISLARDREDVGIDLFFPSTIKKQYEIIGKRSEVDFTLFQAAIDEFIASL